METANLSLFNEIQVENKRDNHVVKSIPQNPPTNPLADIQKSLESIFPEEYQQTRVSKARQTLGSSAESYSDIQIETLVTDFEYLASAWLDLFEREIFNGKTLKEVLGESKNK
ncbi:hypothetical protein A2631_02185 [Candidatus Daviesbacteria bacterium RIFCSPHIGHO2_01_FULL_44_29]|uniref:Uncharacterized protein n=1 Tax=Candidatus Daviesbacteria bacterium RIFCSPHIGHO2_02_FULL_43_12 TaxID=1797776 RepID=A0A1F5KJX9_9BACT|nr:MAG: hypothetical protein A2631_02185 [Candidatus Daviesbacteria bacterium RIFCSPHIGHO2_01_FULL_44_29]OGE39522.1 MAG: hypothetical protein A3E86_01715 [Candidatus Daviesbacteria bacterium RIFCSPHIGHO2_12_FULL_47_45]OGE41202.1 MAG: hypothetical protein A3D25_01580 [Candidatus Daviesbacteria bacterium RIFCSPHIGHO2_02_FULL_43_12]OGE69401.1 MAG: hypothetical protein A3B55_03320 [Candidatus Daviesbacteria bacterium RIFCSPLOWO2_01_FULL_43_15]